MPDFGSSGGFGFGGSDKKQIIVGKIEDIKSAPKYGERRVIVREKSGRRSTLAVDMPTDCSSKLERKETYRFQVEEKEDTRNGYQSSMKTSSFRTYECDDVPEKYTGSSYSSPYGGRFGGNETDSRFGRKFT